MAKSMGHGIACTDYDAVTSDDRVMVLLGYVVLTAQLQPLLGCCLHERAVKWIQQYSSDCWQGTLTEAIKQ